MTSRDDQGEQAAGLAAFAVVQYAWGVMQAGVATPPGGYCAVERELDGVVEWLWSDGGRNFVGPCAVRSFDPSAR